MGTLAGIAAATLAAFALLGWKVHKVEIAPKRKRHVIWPCSDDTPECKQRFERHFQRAMRS